MFNFVKKRVGPIGVELSRGYLKMAQLSFDSNGLYLNNACYHELPDDIEYGSGDWQRWAADTIKKMVSHKGFNGKDVITMISSDHVFVEQIKIPKSDQDSLEKKASFL